MHKTTMKLSKSMELAEEIEFERVEKDMKSSQVFQEEYQSQLKRMKDAICESGSEEAGLLSLV